MMQSDFILLVRNCFDVINNDVYQDWWPETLVYIERHNHTFEVFARAQSNEYFDRIKCMFDIDDKKDFVPLFDAFRKGKLRIPHWNYTTINPEVLLGFESLAIRP